MYSVHKVGVRRTVNYSARIIVLEAQRAAQKCTRKPIQYSYHERRLTLGSLVFLSPNDSSDPLCHLERM